MKYYYFYQNNSGGGYLGIDGDPDCHHLIVEASSNENANRIASKHIVLDTAECECCGDNFDSFSDHLIRELGQNRYIYEVLPVWMRSSARVKIIYNLNRDIS